MAKTAENQLESDAQFWSKFAPILIRGAGSYLANTITNGENAKLQEAKEQFWSGIVGALAPYLIDKIAGGEIAMSEVANALPEEARAEFWPTVLSGLLSRAISHAG